MSFRLKGRAFFVTWSQLPFLQDDIPELQDLLGSILLLFRLFNATTFTRVCLERHSDGGYHVHAFVQYPTPIDRRLSSQWDYLGVHPNVKPKRTRSEQDAAVTYCEKEGFWLDEGERPSRPDSAAGTSSGISIVPDIATAVIDFSTYPSWLQFCYEHRVPSGYATEFWRSCRVGVETLELTEASEGQVSSPGLRDLHFDLERDRALVLVGPSGGGKLTWARREAPKPCLFVRHSDDLKHFRAGYHVAIIFDDMCFCGDLAGRGAWPRTSQIHLVDFDVGSSIHCRYTTVYIPAGVYKIFTGNTYMFTGPDAAIERRVHLLEL
ncbi:hypothetical protein DFS34DRAFT_668536 [Phlyctochytrium arcticum]|nr:hypothetical protein DFS34DRAFT_668536 [Phlyctochytrium arcticum]